MQRESNACTRSQSSRKRSASKSARRVRLGALRQTPMIAKNTIRLPTHDAMNVSVRAHGMPSM